MLFIGEQYNLQYVQKVTTSWTHGTMNKYLAAKKGFFVTNKDLEP